jgi:DEAD/DEAH box helicase domain-containing protein
MPQGNSKNLWGEKIMDYCIFDIEISKTIEQVARELSLKTEGEAFNFPHKCGFSVGVIYSSKSKEYLVFNSAKEMAKYLLDFDGLIVSFNGRRFDIPTLLNDCDIDTFLWLQQKKHLDLLADFYNNVKGRFRVSLNNIAENTIGEVKSGKGADAPLLFQQGKIGELVDYCKMDVQLTLEIFEFGCQNGYINYYDSQKGEKDEMPVTYLDWMIDEDVADSF